MFLWLSEVRNHFTNFQTENVCLCSLKEDQKLIKKTCKVKLLQSLTNGENLPKTRSQRKFASGLFRKLSID